jgi:hypothetical protein
MRSRIASLAVAAALFAAAGLSPAEACMHCDPAFLMDTVYGSTCVITTIDYDCQVCTVVPDPCDPTGGHVWHRY